MHAVANPIVAFYLVHRNAQEPGCSQVKSDVLTRVTCSETSPNHEPDTAWRVTFDPKSTLRNLIFLADFGSDPKCTIVLGGPNVGPLHCTLYAQLNSGQNMISIEDCSKSGTAFADADDIRAGTQVKLRQTRLCARGFRTIDIGPYKFSIQPPLLEAEIAEARNWFLDHEPELVTRPMLKAQLEGGSPNFEEVRQVGEGGNGKVFQFVEKRTGLLFAVKKQLECSDKNAEREVKLMKRLQSEPVSFIHEQGFLHQDIKPENFFIVKKKPIEIVLGDFGHTISMQDHTLPKLNCGTDGFAAPERMVQPHTTALDVYSLGVSFFVMLEFERLKSDVKWKECLKNIAQQPPRLYGGLIKRMVATEPKDRPSLQVCMAVIRGKQYNWGEEVQFSHAMTQVRRPRHRYDAWPGNLTGTARYRTGPLIFGDLAGKRNVAKMNPCVDQSSKATTHGNLKNEAGPTLSTLLSHGAGQPPKANTQHKTLVPRETKIRTATPFAVLDSRDQPANDTTHHNIFARVHAKDRAAPHASPVHKREHKDNVPKPQLRDQASNRITGPAPHARRRISTRSQLRRSPIRKANIDHAFAIGQRITRICATTTDMASCLYYLGSGLVTNTCDIALLSIDAFKLFQDVGRVRQVIKNMGPEASATLGDATRLAAGMKSKKLRFVTPAEYEQERMLSTQLTTGSKQLVRKG